MPRLALACLALSARGACSGPEQAAREPLGQRLAFASCRSGSRTGETNLFVARWVE